MLTLENRQFDIAAQDQHSFRKYPDICEQKIAYQMKTLNQTRVIFERPQD